MVERFSSEPAAMLAVPEPFVHTLRGSLTIARHDTSDESESSYLDSMLYHTFGWLCCSGKVEDLNRELKEMRALVEELHSALRAEQVENSNLQVNSVR